MPISILMFRYTHMYMHKNVDTYIHLVSLYLYLRAGISVDVRMSFAVMTTQIWFLNSNTTVCADAGPSLCAPWAAALQLRTALEPLVSESNLG